MISVVPAKAGIHNENPRRPYFVVIQQGNVYRSDQQLRRVHKNTNKERNADGRIPVTTWQRVDSRFRRTDTRDAFRGNDALSGLPGMTPCAVLADGNGCRFKEGMRFRGPCSEEVRLSLPHRAGWLREAFRRRCSSFRLGQEYEHRPDAYPSVPSLRRPPFPSG